MIRVVLFLFFCASNALSAQSHELTVSFEGATEYPTRIAYEILDEHGTTIQAGFLAVKDAKSTYVITAEIAQDPFAVQVYEDENSNSKLDRGFFNQPLEKYAFSNEAWAVLSKPEIKEMLVQPKGQSTRMRFKLKSVTDF